MDVPARPLAALLALALVAPASWGAPPDPELELGVSQVEGGDFEAAVVTLDAVARRLASAGEPKDRARAYTYLAIAYLGLAQEQAAKARFVEALKAEPGLQLDPREYPPRVVQFFEQVKAEGQAGGPRAPDASATTTAKPTAPVAAAAPTRRRRPARSCHRPLSPTCRRARRRRSRTSTWSAPSR
jgi:hypothetical protein